MLLSIFMNLYVHIQSGVPWVLASEIYPMRVRAIAVGQAAFINWVCAFVVAQTFLDQVIIIIIIIIINDQK